LEEVAEVYARALFEAAKDHDALDQVHEQLGQFADALSNSRDLMQFFFSPYFSVDEKKDALHRAVNEADAIFMNFLEALLERHRMPVIFRIQARFEQLWEEEHRLLPVEVTSAVALDERTVSGIGESIGKQLGRTIELSSSVDPEIIGGVVLRVGNFVLDASIRNRLEKLRQQVARA
jgi:F-type H+-transporting ATPase subunit delta